MELKGISILVVDDEPFLLDSVIDQFEMADAVVEGAENGKQAFELLSAKKFDVLFCDVRMPGGGGIDLVKRILAELPYKPKLFLYSGFNDYTEKEVKDLGVIRIFSKPFDYDEVINAIYTAVHGSKQKSS
jgi:YesN/AraC family two-component response regulator